MKLRTLTKISLTLFCFIGSVVSGFSQDKKPPRKPKIAKPKIADTVKATVYADNWFKLYLNGNLVAVDSISFIPHNVVSVDILPEYPMTIAVMANG